MISDFTLHLLSHKLFIVLHNCIALQMSAGLDAILDFGLNVPINAASFPSLICQQHLRSEALSASVWKYPVNSKMWHFDRHTKMIRLS